MRCEIQWSHNVLTLESKCSKGNYFSVGGNHSIPTWRHRQSQAWEIKGWRLKHVKHAVYNKAVSIDTKGFAEGVDSNPLFFSTGFIEVYSVFHELCVFPRKCRILLLHFLHYLHYRHLIET